MYMYNKKHKISKEEKVVDNDIFQKHKSAKFI